mgnify:CR=1 FL=1|jgi:hypothetical protein
MEEWLNTLLFKILNKDQDLFDFMKRKYYNHNISSTETFMIFTKKHHGYFGIYEWSDDLLEKIPFQQAKIWIEHRIPIGRCTYITGLDKNGKPLPRIKPWGEKEEKLAEILVHVLKSAGIKI